MIAMCPKCSGPVIKDLEIQAAGTARIRWTQRCPHCKRSVRMEIKVENVASVSVDGRMVQGRASEEDGGIRELGA